MNQCTGCEKSVEYELIQTPDAFHNLCAECWPEIHEAIEENMKDNKRENNK